MPNGTMEFHTMIQGLTRKFHSTAGARGQTDGKAPLVAETESAPRVQMALIPFFRPVHLLP